MRRRTKKRLMMAGVVAVIAIGAFRIYGPKDERPMVQAFSSIWAAEDLAWTELFGKHALSFNLNLERGTGEVQATDERLIGFCGTVLSDLPNPPQPDLDARDVYRLTFNIKNQRNLMFPQDIAMVVDDGTCMTEGDGAAPYRYPAPLAGWVLRDAEDAALRGGEVLETAFMWAGAHEIDLSAFAFDQACAALLTDPPLPLSLKLAKGAFEQVTIWAEKRLGTEGSGQFTATSMTFDIADNICVRAEL